MALRTAGVPVPIQPPLTRIAEACGSNSHCFGNCPSTYWEGSGGRSYGQAKALAEARAEEEARTANHVITPASHHTNDTNSPIPSGLTDFLGNGSSPVNTNGVPTSGVPVPGKHFQPSEPKPVLPKIAPYGVTLASFGFAGGDFQPPSLDRLASNWRQVHCPCTTKASGTVFGGISGDAFDVIGGTASLFGYLGGDFTHTLNRDGSITLSWSGVEYGLMGTAGIGVGSDVGADIFGGASWTKPSELMGLGYEYEASPHSGLGGEIGGWTDRRGDLDAIYGSYGVGLPGMSAGHAAVTETARILHSTVPNGQVTVPQSPSVCSQIGLPSGACP